MSIKQHLDTPGLVCPECGYEFIFCDVRGCENFAEWEGWMKRGVMNIRVRVCEKHKTLTIGGQLENER